MPSVRAALATSGASLPRVTFKFFDRCTCRFQGEYATSLETFKTNLKEFGLGQHLEAGRLRILKVGR